MAHLALQVDGPLLRQHCLQRLQKDRLLEVTWHHQLDGGGRDAVAVVIAGHTLPLTLQPHQGISHTLRSTSY